MTERRILLSGIPGGGKTTVGVALEHFYGFSHVDMEADAFAEARRCRMDPSGFVAALPAGDLVVSWGFGPLRDRASVAALVGSGLIPVWLDGDRGHFLSSFLRRDHGKPELEVDFYNQMTAIVQTSIVTASPWRIVNPFNADGTFVPDLPARVLAAADGRSGVQWRRR